MEDPEMVQKESREKLTPLQTFGVSLRRERELRGITLQEISENTKINIRFLETLEATGTGNFEDLPAETFIKGFLRAYSKELGLNADKIILEYEYFKSLQEKDKTTRKPITSGETSVQRKVWLCIILIVLAIAVCLSSYFFKKNQKTQENPFGMDTPAQNAFVTNPEPEDSEAANSSTNLAVAEGVAINENQPSEEMSVEEFLNSVGEIQNENGYEIVPENNIKKSGSTTGNGALQITTLEEVSLQIQADDVLVFTGSLWRDQVKTFYADKEFLLKAENPLQFNKIKLKLNDLDINLENLQKTTAIANSATVITSGTTTELKEILIPVPVLSEEEKIPVLPVVQPH